MGEVAEARLPTKLVPLKEEDSHGGAFRHPHAGLFGIYWLSQMHTYDEGWYRFNAEEGVGPYETSVDAYLGAFNTPVQPRTKWAPPLRVKST